MSFTTFVSEIKKVFDHPVWGRDAAKCLLSLRQGSHSVAEFSVEFRTIAEDSGWNDEALQGIFVGGLSELLKDELVSRDDPASLDVLVSQAIKVDNRLHERRR